MLQNPWDSTYYSAFIKEYHYDIPFGDDSLYYENWSYNNGKKWEERVFHKDKGIIKLVIYNKNGTKHSDFEKYPNCSISRQWDNKGRLKSINIDDKMSYCLIVGRNAARR